MRLDWRLGVGNLASSCRLVLGPISSSLADCLIALYYSETHCDLRVVKIGCRTGQNLCMYLCSSPSTSITDTAWRI